MSQTLASIQGLTVQYGSFTALNDFSGEIREGCTGLLGPNGAGKTTLLKTLLGFVKPAAGRASILGLDAATDGRRIRQLVGLMPEQDCHIPGMSAVAFVAYAGELAGMPEAEAIRRAHEVLEYAGLGEARYRNVETFSTGMKQRIKLAQALVHGPKLLLLDEPTNGLDPRGREEMLDLVRDVSHGKGVHVLVSSHLLPDIERVCDQVLVVLRGQLRAEGGIRELKTIAGSPIQVDLREVSPAFVAGVEATGARVVPQSFSTYRIEGFGDPHASVARLLAIAREAGAQIRGVAPAERSLEEAFLQTLDDPDAANAPIPPPVVHDSANHARVGVGR